MRVVDHERQSREEWRAGVYTACVSRLSLARCNPASSSNGASRLGRRHIYTLSEVLTVLEGQAEFWIENEREAVTAGQSVIVPAGRRHGFRNTGVTTLHVQATLAAPIFEASFDNQNEVSRRWVPSAIPFSA